MNSLPFQNGRFKLYKNNRVDIKFSTEEYAFCLAELMVIIIISPFQPVEAAVPGVGVVDVLRGDGAVRGEAAVDQVKNLFVQCLPTSALGIRGHASTT